MRFVKVLGISFMIASDLFAQTPSISNVLNATGAPGLSPGAIATIRGVKIDPGGDEFTNFSSPFVKVGGRPAQLLFAYPDSALRIQIPPDVDPGPAQVVVSTDLGTSAPFEITLDAYSPGVFQVSSTGEVRPSGCYSRVAAPGDIGAVLATGLGATTLDSATVAKPTITVGGASAEVLESGLDPRRSLGSDVSGQYLVTFKVPPGSGSRGVVLSIGGKSSNALPLEVGPTFTDSEFLIVSGATWAAGAAAPASIMVAHSCYPKRLADVGEQRLVADPRNPPATLGGVSVVVKGAAEHLAQLLFVSAYQVNFIVPPETPRGIATIVVNSASGMSHTAFLKIDTVVPALFPAGQIVRVRNGVRTTEAVSVPVGFVQGGPNDLASSIIDLGPQTDEVYLILFGTGLRFLGALENVKAKIGGVDVPVEYAGPQNEYAGVDQVNLKLPRSLAGRGGAVELTIEGEASNLAYVAFR